MQVSNLLTGTPEISALRLPPPGDSSLQASPPIHRIQTDAPYHMMRSGPDSAMMDVYPSTETASAHGSLSPTKGAHPKHVSFELLLQSPQHRARLPMRVNIFPHDTTDSIITTVKNFYGLYERCGVVFEDRDGTTLIARYENFAHDMTVYVRLIADVPEVDEFSPAPQKPLSPRRSRLDEPFQMLPPSLHHASRRQSPSPQPGRGRRSASVSKRARSNAKSRGNSSHGSFADPNGEGEYSDSDGGEGSVTSSRRSRKEHVASAEISVDNIVEGGRRKRAKFDSSELPLFVPPQVPMTASASSISPQRRISSTNGASPYSLNNQQTFTYPQPLPSPQSYGHGDSSYLNGLITPHSASNGPTQGYRSRMRNPPFASSRQPATGGAVLPTPDPTLGSMSQISDEDVARQLMRLGDASNFSTHGRTSTSTLDDALSGKAELASSGEETDDGSEDEQELPPLPYPMGPSAGDHVNAVRGYDSGDSSSEDDEDNKDGSFRGDSDEVVPSEHHDQRIQTVASKARSSVSGKSSKPGKPRALPKAKSKSNGATKTPMSPSSLPSQSRKASTASLNFQHQFGVDEEDLSSKPRCQRCRKSKKGCDRQRPCQRCKDAGIGIEGCISEDEGNGRKGRYGRHMGVPVKKSQALQMDQPLAHNLNVKAENTPPPAFSASAVDKSKKRKR